MCDLKTAFDASRTFHWCRERENIRAAVRDEEVRDYLCWWQP
jgi:hypothetical protein